MTKDDLVDALRQHGIWLCDSSRDGQSSGSKRVYAIGEELLQLATEVASTPSDALPVDLQARLRSWLPGIYRAQGEDLIWPHDNEAYHQRLSRLSAAIEQLAPRGSR
jgi:hypothetical protein